MCVLLKLLISVYTASSETLSLKPLLQENQMQGDMGGGGGGGEGGSGKDIKLMCETITCAKWNDHTHYKITMDNK